MGEPEVNKYNSVIFLDQDGVLNHQLFYDEKFAHLKRYDGIPLYKIVKKFLRKQLKQKELSDLEYYKSQTSLMGIELLNWLCKETNSAIVITASLRSSWSVEELQRIYNYCGATFTIIDKTPYTGYERGLK